jgi:hypothetical protein
MGKDAAEIPKEFHTRLGHHVAHRGLFSGSLINDRGPLSMRVFAGSPEPTG